MLELGLCKGVFPKEKPNGVIEHYLVLSVEEPNEWGETAEVSVGIRISKRQLDSGIENAYKKYAGKQIAVPIYVRSWKSDRTGAHGWDRWLSGDGLPVPVQRIQPVQAAS